MLAPYRSGQAGRKALAMSRRSAPANRDTLPPRLQPSSTGPTCRRRKVPKSRSAYVCTSHITSEGAVSRRCTGWMVPTCLSGVAVPPLWLHREVLLQTNSAALRDLRLKTPHQRRPREHCSRLPPISELPKCVMYIAYIMPLFNYAADGHSSPGSPRLASCGKGGQQGLPRRRH